MPSEQITVQSQRRHRARQIRARIVQLAREYRSVLGDWEAARDDAAVGGWEEQQREDGRFDLLELAQRALFQALEELDILEEGGQ
jgi:coenzyme F420-reducing hydrogenase alpha subunit